MKIRYTIQKYLKLRIAYWIKLKCLTQHSENYRIMKLLKRNLNIILVQGPKFYPKVSFCLIFFLLPLTCPIPSWLNLVATYLTFMPQRLFSNCFLLPGVPSSEIYLSKCTHPSKFQVKCPLSLTLSWSPCK